MTPSPLAGEGRGEGLTNSIRHANSFPFASTAFRCPYCSTVSPLGAMRLIVSADCVARQLPVSARSRRRVDGGGWKGNGSPQSRPVPRC
jgi:hypothetical protein